MDYYTILDLNENCTKEEIKKKYRELCLIYHPDKNNGDDKQFKKINEAYETLYDIEDQLIVADLGVEVAGRIAKKIKDQKFELNKNKEIEKTQIAKTLAEEIEQILLPREQNLYEKSGGDENVLCY